MTHRRLTGDPTGLPLLAACGGGDGTDTETEGRPQEDSNGTGQIRNDVHSAHSEAAARHIVPRLG